MQPSALAPFAAPSLAQELSTLLTERTNAEVRFDHDSRALYASDLSSYRQVPVGVVIPRSEEDVIATVATCREYGVPILGRGAGTSLAGQTCNIAVVIDFSKYLNQLLDLDSRHRYAWVQPGLINDDLRGAAEKHQLTFAPDPATHQYCTLGGMIGNNSCGAHSVLGGKTSENIEELDILLYDGTRLTVGATSDKELDRIIREGGRRGQIYSSLHELRDTYASEIRKRYPNIPRRVSGYNLDYLLPENGFHVARALVGSESTCALVLRAKTRLIHSPQHRVLLIASYPSVFAAGDRSPQWSDLDPIAIEGFQRRVIDNEHLKGKAVPGLNLFSKGDAWLLIEFGADSREEATAKGRKALAWAKSHDRDQCGVQLLEDPHIQKQAMEVRELGLGASRVPGKLPDTWPGWEDAAVDPKKLGPYLRDFYALCDRYNYFVVLYGHFGQGCMHCRMDFDFATDQGVAKYRSFVTEAAHLVVKYGGSLSGEHGDGQARAELLPIMFGDRLIEAFARFKRIWDPAWKMNPGKVVDPYPLDSNLRQGPDYRPQQPLTIFQFPDDHGSLAEATERCFGVGKCRKLEGGTMCPSFRVTREEKHTTRGRARLLFEMLRGDSILDGWRDEGIKDALDLCLACKGCKGDCPVSVDVATYKAEFLAHYYEGRRRPNYAYSMGLIDKWAALGSQFPELANLFTQTPGLAAISKKIAGVTEQRDMPAFPRQTFKQWLASRESTQNLSSRPKSSPNLSSRPKSSPNLSSRPKSSPNLSSRPQSASNLSSRPQSASNLSSRPKRSEVERPASSTRGPQARAYVSSPSNVRGEVILWADTFNNYFLPHTAQAALEVLEDAGFRVRVPRQHLCCGRPLYDFGMLDEAKTYLRKVLSALATDIAAGTPVVCLEPSCASVFCDELVNLFPNEDAARRLSKQVILFPDFLQKVGYQPGKLTGKAIVHGHCHHKALWSMHPEQQLLQSAGLDAHVLDSGCCGLAGSFGYEAGHHDISVAIGEHALFPPVRAASRDTLIVSDGFSCRQQIAHGTPRQALHTAEVLQMALHPQPKRKRNRFIETGHTQPNPGYPVLTALAAGLGLLGAGIFLLSRTNGQRPTSNASKPVSTR